jgi:glycosyltransferase involved in cell wall biosynthesis
MTSQSYALITAAWNEEAYIEYPLRAVIGQTLLPKRWVVVSDGSTDRTDEIVRDYARDYPFIEIYRLDANHKRSFAAQVDAINAGYQHIRHLDFEFIANLDADLSFEPDYYQKLLGEFQNDDRLGLAGGTIFDKREGRFVERRLNRTHSVMHGVQMFRRECFDAIGGYARLPYGSPDWHAEVSLRMKGWRVRSIKGLKAYHYRPTGTAGNPIWYGYRQGLADYSLGTHPLFEMAKVARRLPVRWGLPAAAEAFGFLESYLKHAPRAVSSEFMAYLRKEQIARIRGRSEWESLNRVGQAEE